TSGTITASVPVRWRLSPRARRLGTYPSSEIASSTRRRVLGLTRPLSLITRDTVIGETPERRATSLIVTLVAGVCIAVIGTTEVGRTHACSLLLALDLAARDVLSVTKPPPTRAGK